MRRAFVVAMLSAGLLWVVPATGATGPGAQEPRAVVLQPGGPCVGWTLADLRGTYTFTATAWQDLSQINPELPGGYAPVTIIGTFVVRGNGEVTGTASINAGGLPLSAEFVDSRMGAPRADCSFTLSLSMKISDFGDAIVGPYPYVGVIAGDRAALEVAYMMLGASPGSHVELDRARRISTRTN